MLLFDHMTVNMKGGKPQESYSSCTRLGNDRNTAGVNHSFSWAIYEFQWSHSRLQELSKFQIIGDGYIIVINYDADLVNIPLNEMKKLRENPPYFF